MSYWANSFAYGFMLSFGLILLSSSVGIKFASSNYWKFLIGGVLVCASLCYRIGVKS